MRLVDPWRNGESDPTQGAPRLRQDRSVMDEINLRRSDATSDAMASTVRP